MVSIFLHDILIQCGGSIVIDLDNMCFCFGLNVFFSGTNNTDKDLVRLKLRHYPLHVLPLNVGMDLSIYTLQSGSSGKSVSSYTGTDRSYAKENNVEWRQLHELYRFHEVLLLYVRN